MHVRNIGKFDTGIKFQIKFKIAAPAFQRLLQAAVGRMDGGTC